MLAARLAAGEAEFLTLLAELDHRGGWAEAGIVSCAHWLSLHCAMTTGTAREHVRIARALTHLPLIRAAFAAGRLSYFKVRALTRTATPTDEADLLGVALCATANQLDRFVAGVRTAETLTDINLRHQRRSLTWRTDTDGSILISLRCSPEDGATILEAIHHTHDHLTTTSANSRVDSRNGADGGGADRCAADSGGTGSVGGGGSGASDDQASAEPHPGVRVATRAQAPGKAGRLAASRLDALVLLCAEATLPGKEPGTWKQALGSRRSETILHVTLDDLATAVQPRTRTPNAQARDTPGTFPRERPILPRGSEATGLTRRATRRTAFPRERRAHHERAARAG
ncbi:DUF222 domain-containing protein [Miniimonas arenae]|nr:DUF222 domain-containing protein [Miniimonas arenae]